MESSSLARIARRLPLVFVFALLATLLLAGCGSSNHINSVAATVNQLSDSRGLVVDSAGNIYIANAGLHEIALATKSTSLLSVFAGNGLPCPTPTTSCGDGQAATSAELNFPQGVVRDSLGNLFIADTSNNRIREVAASTGIISTVAGTGTAGFSGDGGAASAATLNLPQALALDSSGNLYIADTGNNVIRKITASAGVISANDSISTVAGNGTRCTTAPSCGDGSAATSALLNTPADVKVDSSGNIYIADQSNFVVREVSSAGVITTVAGNYSTGYSGDSGAATSAQLNSPQAVAVDSSGNLYIADTGNNVIRRVSGGTINTVVGNGMQGYTGDGGSPTGAELNYPDGLTFDTGGVLYIDDAGNRVIRTVKF